MGVIMETNDIILSMSGIHISFPGVHALNDVSFTLRHGEIHSIMGQNGAGKSTLIKILTGVYRKDRGTITLDGNPFEPSSPLEARHYGVNSVYQEINLCDNLTVAENIYAGRQKTTFGKINWKAINSDAVKALARLNVTVDVTKPLVDYTVAIKQMVAIARAVDMDSKILILDEPTSSLDRAEVEQLFTVVRKLRDEGMSIIFITHFLDQVYELCDKVTILRNGKLIGEYLLTDLPKVELVSKMIGMEFSTLEKKENTRKNTEENEVIMEANNIGKRRTVQPFDLTLRKGEILGFAGLLGSGRTESANLLFGIDEIDTGEIKLKNKKIKLKKPRDAISRYIAFCPEDRKLNGIVADLSVRENIILAMQGKQGIFKYIPFKKQKEIAENYIKILNIATPGHDIPVGSLSGGNQQKVILARWLVTHPELLILDEPTRGIDVYAKVEIMNMAMKLCNEGMSVVFISSELDEVIRCSDRIAVMRDRKKITEMSGVNLNEQMILKAIAAEEVERR
jgi:simple sugar transport system ATP-binding protein